MATNALTPPRPRPRRRRGFGDGCPAPRPAAPGVLHPSEADAPTLRLEPAARGREARAPHGPAIADGPASVGQPAETVQVSTFAALRGSTLVVAVVVLSVAAMLLLAGGALRFDGWPAGPFPAPPDQTLKPAPQPPPYPLGRPAGTASKRGGAEERHAGRGRDGAARRERRGRGRPQRGDRSGEAPPNRLDGSGTQGRTPAAPAPGAGASPRSGDSGTAEAPADRTGPGSGAPPQESSPLGRAAELIAPGLPFLGAAPRGPGAKGSP